MNNALPSPVACQVLLFMNNCDSNPVCDPSLLLVDFYKSMNGAEAATDVEYKFTINNKVIAANLRVTFLSHQEFLANAFAAPRNEGGLDRSGYFIEQCSGSQIIYRVEEHRGGEIEKLRPELVEYLCVSGKSRAEILGKCRKQVLALQR